MPDTLLRPFLDAYFEQAEDLIHRQETGAIGIHEAHVELNRLMAQLRDDIGIAFAKGSLAGNPLALRKEPRHVKQ